MHVLTSIKVDKSQQRRNKYKIVRFGDNCEFYAKRS